MKPKELLKFNVDTYLVSFFKELGFDYSQSKFTFTKKVNALKFKISLSPNRHNQENDCDFWSMWSIESSEYGIWYQKTFQEKPPNNYIYGESDWNIPNWSKKSHFQLINKPDHDKKEMEEFKRNIVEFGLPQLSIMSDFSVAAERLKKTNCLIETAVDLLYLSGDIKSAQEALNVRLSQLTGSSQLEEMEMKRLEIRKNLLFSDKTK